MDFEMRILVLVCRLPILIKASTLRVKFGRVAANVCLFVRLSLTMQCKSNLDRTGSC